MFKTKHIHLISSLSIGGVAIEKYFTVNYKSWIRLGYKSLISFEMNQIALFETSPHFPLVSDLVFPETGTNFITLFYNTIFNKTLKKAKRSQQNVALH